MTLQRGWAAAALAAGLAAAGCTLAEVSEPVSEEVVVVEAVLRTDSEVQAVLLHRSLNGRVVEGVPGATVTLTDEDGNVYPLEEAGNSCYRYSLGYFDVRPGDVRATCYESASSIQEPFVVPGRAYDLRVELSGGGTIRGRTRVPGSFALRNLPYSTIDQGFAGCWVPAESLLGIAWTPSAGAWAYLSPIRLRGIRDSLEARGIANVPDPVELQGLAISESDTTILFPTEFGVFDRAEYAEVLAALQNGLPDGASADLVVAAADRNYVNGVRGGRFNPSGPVRVSSVVGDGVGVFGSLVPLSLHISVGTPQNLPPQDPNAGRCMGVQLDG